MSWSLVCQITPRLDSPIGGGTRVSEGSVGDECLGTRCLTDLESRGDEPVEHPAGEDYDAAVEHRLRARAVGEAAAHSCDRSLRQWREMRDPREKYAATRKAAETMSLSMNSDSVIAPSRRPTGAHLPASGRPGPAIARRRRLRLWSPSTSKM